jgi:3-hydroxybutyryl-CoA dehydrogenase
MKSVQNVAVIGAGTMGNGIAQVFALHGYEVTLIDVSGQALEKAIHTIQGSLERMAKKELISADAISSVMGKIHTNTDTGAGVGSADIVVEAATEKVELKLELFRTIDKHAPSHAILASNTSSISITLLASATQRPAQVIGMHFMNPVPVMQLVEVIRGYSTSDEVTKVVMALSGNVGKIPVEVNDYPGFVANRILMPMINEAVYALYEGVAGVSEIDTVMKLGMAHPMGPLALADFIGLDVCHSILRIMHDGLGNQKYAPCPLLTNMVVAGMLGRKSGQGFYDYAHGGKDLVVSAKFLK